MNPEKLKNIRTIDDMIEGSGLRKKDRKLLKTAIRTSNEEDAIIIGGLAAKLYESPKTQNKYPVTDIDYYKDGEPNGVWEKKDLIQGYRMSASEQTITLTGHIIYTRRGEYKEDLFTHNIGRIQNPRVNYYEITTEEGTVKVATPGALLGLWLATPGFSKKRMERLRAAFHLMTEKEKEEMITDARKIPNPIIEQQKIIKHHYERKDPEFYNTIIRVYQPKSRLP